MSRRIEIELTSNREDTWTWRAAGAREPKGVIGAALLPSQAAIGDILRVEADFFVDGIEITSVLPPKGERKEPERIEIKGSGRDEAAGVTTTLVGKGGRGGRDRGERDGRDRGGRSGPRSGERSSRPPRGRSERTEQHEGRADRNRTESPAAPSKPKPKRLRPQRTHRNVVLAELPEAQRAIAEQVLRGGIPGVRKAVDDQNELNRSEGRTEINPAPLVQLAEDLLPRLKAAEWHDRAEAALAGVGELDLRDLRSVVVAAESNARSEQTRLLAEELRAGLSARVDSEHAGWLTEIAEALSDGRTVRALRMSSRPPKAGAPLPPDLGNRLAAAAAESLTDDTGPQRWGTVLDAVAYSPVRELVVPAGLPPKPNDELLETVRKLSTRVPAIAAMFGIEPVKPPRRKRRARADGPSGATGAPVPPPPPTSPPSAPSAAPSAAPAPPSEPSAVPAPPSEPPAAPAPPSAESAQSVAPSEPSAVPAPPSDTTD